MAEPEAQNQPLIGGQTAINVPAQSGRSSRAYKVAGITLLACVLIVGQAMIAYFLLSQRGDIKTLEEQNNNLKSEMTKGRSVAVPMHMPMNSLPMLMDDSLEEEASTGAPEKTVPPQATDCQLEAAGLKTMSVPGFRPTCDSRGLYVAKQCYVGICWCVSPQTGQEIPNTMSHGPVRCSAAGRASKMMVLSDDA